MPYRGTIKVVVVVQPDRMWQTMFPPLLRRTAHDISGPGRLRERGKKDIPKQGKHELKIHRKKANKNISGRHTRKRHFFFFLVRMSSTRDTRAPNSSLFSLPGTEEKCGGDVVGGRALLGIRHDEQLRQKGFKTGFARFPHKGAATEKGARPTAATISISIRDMNSRVAAKVALPPRDETRAARARKSRHEPDPQSNTQMRRRKHRRAGVVRPWQ